MEMKRVHSSNVGSVGYNNGLFVKFNSGKVYKYFGVPEETFNRMMAAESKGKFLNAEVKHIYDYKLLGDISQLNDIVEID